MLTVLEAIKLSTDYLEKKGIESARMNAELLLAEILKCERLDLYLKFDRPLKQIEIDNYRDFISRRGKFEPLQYIVGNVEFFGLTFYINSDVLIPRPETEILVEKIIECNKELDDLKILEIGTGSGNIAVCLAKYLNISSLISIDISEKSLCVARENALKYSLGEIEFIQCDILDGEKLNQSDFDIIVSNPPYVGKKEYLTLQKEITDFEPKLAVTDNNDGISFYKRIAEIAQEKLKENGKIYFELGKGQAGEVKKILEENRFSDIQITQDYQDIERVICGIKT